MTSNVVVRVANRWIQRRMSSRPSEVIYTGVFLSPMDRQRLIRRFGQEHSQAFAHHMTLWMVNDGGDPGLEDLPLGKTVDLKIVGYVADDKGQAVVVQPPTRLRPRNGRVPHVTISTAVGVPPSYSKTLTEDFDTSDQAGKGFPKLEGKVGWWDGQEVRFDVPQAKTAAFRNAPGGVMIGYKVMNWDPIRKEVVSGANSTIRLPLRKGAVHRMPGVGIFLGNDARYVLDNYAVHDYNALITYTFDPADLKYGNLDDREAEIGVSAAKVIDFDLYDADSNLLG